MATKGFDLGQLSLKVSTAGVLDVIGGGTGVTTSTGTGSTVLSASPTLSGVVSIAAGTALLPALIPTSDPNTGLWFPAADTVAISTSGVEAVRIGSSGNVGIGTEVPTQPLDVNGNVAITGTGRRITGDFSNATFANRVAFKTSTTNGNTVVSILPNGTSNTASYDVFNTSDPTNSVRARFGVSASSLAIESSISGTGTYLPMTFYTGGSERARIDTSGNVTMAAYGAGVAKFSSTGVISSGTVTESLGGTNQTTYTTGDLLYASAANTLSKLSAGAVNYVLTSGGAGVAPSWAVRGATGAGGDTVFQENSVVVTTNYTLTTAKNASSVGPITINGGITVTVPSGARWVIL